MNLDQELRALGHELALPPVPNLIPEVRARIERPARPRFRLALAIVGATLVATLAALLAIPQTRAAILRFLRIGGERIERVETQPTAPAGPRTPLGRRVTLDQARAAIEFELGVPDDYRAVYLDRSIPGGMVTFVLAPRVVVSEWPGTQLPYVQKQVGPRTRVEQVEVDGAPGVWLTAAPHVVIFRSPDGETRFRERRLAGNVLVWERDGVTFRLEGMRTKRGALELARNL